jgi:hypothetical protein
VSPAAGGRSLWQAAFRPLLRSSESWSGSCSGQLNGGEREGGKEISGKETWSKEKLERRERTGKKKEKEKSKKRKAKVLTCDNNYFNIGYFLLSLIPSLI